MDPTSRRLVIRIAAWTSALLIVMGIYFFAIRPQLYPAGNEVSEEAAAPVVEDAAKADEAAAEVEPVAGDRDVNGDAEDDDGSMVGPAPEPEEPAEEPQPDDPSDGQ